MFPKYSFLGLATLLFLLGILFLINSKAAQQPANTNLQTNASSSLEQRTKSTNCLVNGPLPDKVCTPGAVFPNATVAQICTSGYSASVRNVPESEKKEVYAEYGISSHQPGEYEVDHLISLELGGSNDIANLFPEAADPTPGFHEKDKVENYLHKLVCEGKISLHQAQIDIAQNWLKYYPIP